MRTYLILAETPFLVSTQDEARNQKRLFGHQWEQAELPDNKAAHLEAVNALLKRAAASAQNIAARAPQEPAELLEPAPASMGQAEVDALFTPRQQPADRKPSWADNPVHTAGPSTDAICDAIAELGGYHLGNVCHAVADRFRELEQQAKVLDA